jgi:hypothetical protein
MSVEESSPTPPARAARRPRLISVLGLVFAAILLSVLGIAAYVGYQAGLDQREAQQRATQAADLQTQFQLGLEDLANQRYQLAADRFQYIVAVDAEFPGAAEKLAEAQAALQITPTAPAPTAPPASGQSPAEGLALAQRYFEAGNWDAAIAQVLFLRTVDPNYETAQANTLLFKALRNRGVARIQGDQMEAGIFDLDQASGFGPLDSDAVNYRAWARLYLAARSYWGVNWAETASILQQLYVLAPNFKDTTRLLYQATLNYAAQLAASDACAAAEQYAAAQQLFTDQPVADAQATAQANCLLTPTATATSEAPSEVTPTPEPGVDPTSEPSP